MRQHVADGLAHRALREHLPLGRFEPAAKLREDRQRLRLPQDAALLVPGFPCDVVRGEFFGAGVHRFRRLRGPRVEDLSPRRRGQFVWHGCTPLLTID